MLFVVRVRFTRGYCFKSTGSSAWSPPSLYGKPWECVIHQVLFKALNTLVHLIFQRHLRHGYYNYHHFATQKRIINHWNSPDWAGPFSTVRVDSTLSRSGLMVLVCICPFHIQTPQPFACLRSAIWLLFSNRERVRGRRRLKGKRRRDTLEMKAA